MLIPLVCKQCGGKLEVEKSQVFESGDIVIVVNDQTFTCPHCGMKYLPGEKIKHAPGISIGAISIGGHATNSTIVVGNGMVVNKSPSPASPKESEETKQHHPTNMQPETKAEKQKSPKKWWQFWEM